MSILISVKSMGGALLAACALSTISFTAPVRAQEDYPSQTIRLIVGYAPGAIADLTARQVAAQLSKELDAPVVVENRPGSGGVLANTFVARAKPDGYTLLYHDSSLVTAPALRGQLDYDYKTELTPVGIAVAGAFFIYGSPGNPANSIQELVQQMQANPDKYFYGSSGVGVLNHIGFELFLNETDTKAQHVPYKGSGPIMVDIMANRVDMSMSSAPGILPQYREGQLKIYAYGGETRSALLPDIPTISESVAPGLTIGNWFGVAAPSGTDEAIIERLSKAMTAVTQEPEFVAAMERDGVEVLGIDHAKAPAFLAEQEELWTGVIERAGVNP